ncbi:hypothetical protein LQZ18_13580 [Lachnospiraceae bacterium ZAX-1]
MAEKMQLLHITGPKHDIDRVMRVYLGKYDIHFENAVTSLNTVGQVHPFTEQNAYKEVFLKAGELIPYLPQTEKDVQIDKQEFIDMDAKAAQGIIDENCLMTDHIKKERQAVLAEEEEQKAFMTQIEPFRSLDFEFPKILGFRFILFRFGRISQQYYRRMEDYILQSTYAFFCECQNDAEFVWGIYFVPHNHAEEVDAVLLSFHFEQIELPETIEGTTEHAYRKAENRCHEIKQELERLSAMMQDLLKKNEIEIWSAYYALERYCKNFEIRKFAVCTTAKGDLGEYYILYGRIAETRVKELLGEIAKDDKIQCIEEAEESIKPEHLKTII